MTTTRIETTRYQASHNKAPKGRGLWMFETASREVVVQHNGTYAEAKQAAIAHGKQHGHAALYVCP